jgi:hypothetical protein
MREQGHGDHWECLGNLENMLQKILPQVIQQGDTVEKSEVVADCFDDEEPNRHTFFSISNNVELSVSALIVANKKQQTNELVSAYPFVQSKNLLRLKITKIHEWSNLVEAVIEGETENEHTISFFDTKYFKNKELYTIGKVYSFAIAALGYDVEILKEKSFSFKGQEAVDWLAKSDNKPTFDAQGNVEPVVFDLSQLVAYLPRTEYPDDAEFQSPINKIETIRAFDKEYYKINITIFRDPDICIDLYTKINFFECKPEINDPVRGVLWLQGYLCEGTKQQSDILDSDGEPVIN